jgi:BirA family transcriptional regulator, biotin operon repressor / biotin---[acetyl-CoA-carboxylase] ligase
VLAGTVDEPAAPSFPPLLRGEVADGDPFRAAVARARAGADPGLVVWAPPADALRAAVVLAPEDPLERAVGVVLAAPLALADALAMLAPPEVAVQFRWPGDVLVNGGRAARCRAAAGGTDPAAVPDWLVLGVEVAFMLPPGLEGGERPDETCLSMEGCGEVAPLALLEGWSRHLIPWINRWTDDGMAPLLAAWGARADGIGAALPQGGVFVGLDATGGMLAKGPGGTTLHPLVGVLEP